MNERQSATVGGVNVMATATSLPRNVLMYTSAVLPAGCTVVATIAYYDVADAKLGDELEVDATIRADGGFEFAIPARTGARSISASSVCRESGKETGLGSLYYVVEDG